MESSKGRSLAIFTAYMLLMMSLQKFSERAFEAMAALVALHFIFSIAVRRSYYFKSYFTGRYNFLTSKIRHEKDYHLPEDVLFDKFIEVITEAGFKVRHADKAKGNIFATTAISFWSWGENIYVDMSEVNGTTHVSFVSACFFGIVSWGRNERNYRHMLETFENSLTI